MRGAWQGSGLGAGHRGSGEGHTLAAIVEFDSVGLRYGTGAEVLRDLDFRLGKGGFYFLTGPSGAGKTSLLKLLYLAQRPTRGRIQLFGEELSDAPRDALPHFRRRIGVVFQDFRLIRHLSAFDNVALPLRIAGASEQEAEAPVREMLAWVGLADRASAASEPTGYNNWMVPSPDTLNSSTALDATSDRSTSTVWPARCWRSSGQMRMICGDRVAMRLSSRIAAVRSTTVGRFATSIP